MTQWHLDALRRALASKGWQVVEADGDEYAISASWMLRRGNDARVICIDFEGLDDMRTLPIDQSYGCSVRGSTQSLHFRRQRSSDLWNDELASFVESLES